MEDWTTKISYTLREVNYRVKAVENMVNSFHDHKFSIHREFLIIFSASAELLFTISEVFLL